MWVAAARSPSGWVLQPMDGEGRPNGPPRSATAPGPAANDAPGSDGARVVWASTAAEYPALLAAGHRVRRCHDLTVVGALLERGSSLGAAPEADAPPSAPDLFDGADLLDDAAPGPAATAAPADPAAVVQAFAEQRAAVERRRAGFTGFHLLVAAESACTLAAAEMTYAGLPWRSDLHDRLLEAQLGPRPRFGGRPQRMQELAVRVADLLAAPSLNVDSQPDLLRALHRAGVPVRSTRAGELRRVDHPVIEPLLRYRELARLFSAHGWTWREQWVREGRFRPEYVPAGVVSGRWASRGGGALQIPKPVRAAVVADPGHRLVIADAGQLEPRILAALARDRAMLALAASSDDLYTAVARRLFGGREADRDPGRLRGEVKIAFLSAMYGGGTGSPASAALRSEFPTALDLLETAARAGETGGVVHSVLGRPCPEAAAEWSDVDHPEAEPSPERKRARGRFARNYVIQSSAADWANVLVALLRLELLDLARGDGEPAPELVFFQHDEVVVHTPEALAADVVAALGRAGRRATRLVLGEGAPAIPLVARIASAYGSGPDSDRAPEPGSAASGGGHASGSPPPEGGDPGHDI